MPIKIKLKNAILPLWIRTLLIATLLVGIFIRFSHLDTKVYWSHEAITSLRISGYTFTEFISEVYDGRELSAKDIQKYLHPNSEKVLFDTIKSLAIEDSQHPPLYYVLARFHAQAFGSSVFVMRLLPDLISLLALPCLYWLCIELFESTLVGWVAVALTALSLLHVIYAQEARQYSLWIVMTLLSSAVLLKALREDISLSYWVFYSVTFVLGLYTFPLSVFVGIAHLIYVFEIERYRLNQQVIYYLISSLVALIFFMPWIFIIISHRDQVAETTAWLTYKMPIPDLVNSWLVHITMIFTSPSKMSSVVLVTILVAYSLYYIVGNAPKRAWLFVLLLTALPALGLILPDLILGGDRSSVGRYQLSSYLGIQLAVAYLFANQITSLSIKPWQRQFWQILMIALIFMEIRIGIKYYQSQDGWARSDNYNPPMAQIINQSKNPLVVSDINEAQNIASILSLSYYLDSSVKLQLVLPPKIPDISSNFSDVFLYSPSKNLRSGIQKNLSSKAVLVYKDNNPVNQNPAMLWKLEKISDREPVQDS